ncbi:DUF4163 domain-containing protein [Altererythrobacter indicus]|uniref:DUF4163 domain-containing protein n=1 Tax=Altericroceibacterium indicum TaxID=374177 RepID=A0A845A9K2_9SPHN|nr:DUF4163 domain-containing protein [Altericroceibacterium indicum]MXP25691.1 DUF4163 domain-containing protein [Altericroceibacterium indicum]
MKRLVSVFAMAALLSACSAGANKADDAVANAEAGASSSASATASADGSSASASISDVKGRSVKVDTDLMQFEYSYPGKAAAIPKLSKLLDRRLDEAGQELEKSATEGQASAKKDNYPYRAYSNVVEWSVVTDLPDWLSLSSTNYSYTGGAHGMTVFDSLLWDKKAEKALNTMDVFISGPALANVVKDAFCDQLDKSRSKKRGEIVKRDEADPFTSCIDPVDNSTVILGSSNGKSFDRIGFLVPAYNAGPYAEGSYEVTLPVTKDVIATVKPQYRASFSAKK